VPRWGTPRRIVTDRGSVLIAEVTKEWCETLGIEMVASTAHHHSTVATVERFWGTLQTLRLKRRTDTQCPRRSR